MWWGVKIKCFLNYLYCVVWFSVLICINLVNIEWFCKGGYMYNMLCFSCYLYENDIDRIYIY